MSRPRLPKPDEYVAIDWIDSGKDVMRVPQSKAATESLSRATTYGRVIDVDDERVLVAMETDDGDEGTYGLIWIPAITRVRRFK